jgi:hypothetical protein
MGSSRETRHFIDRKDLIPSRERLVNPARKENTLANGGVPRHSAFD